MTDIVVQIGGRVQGAPPDILNIQLTYLLGIQQAGPSIGLTIKGIAELNNCIAGLYDLVLNQPANSRVEYSRYWSDRIISQLSLVLDSGNFNINPSVNGFLISITPNFRYRQNVKGFIKTVPSTFLPKYVEAESSGYVQFTPEFNIPTDFDNSNFIRAEDDNFTNHIDEFINSPQFNLALHVRPKKHRKCHKCHNRHCESRESTKNFTNTSALKALVIFLYQTCLSIQTEKISVETGLEMINEKLSMFEKYKAKGASTYSFSVFDNGFLELILCIRYHLQNTDCIVGFTMQGINDIFNNRDGAEYNQIIMNASSAPIDEDMSDVIYPSNTGLFVYQ